MSQRLSKKIFHLCMFFAIIVIIIFIAVMFILNYEENGESNMPFEISKISIISTVDGKSVEDATNKWNFSVDQNNDIYIYIEKNDQYNKQEIIESVSLDNFKMQVSPDRGEIKIYKPSVNNTALFENIDENSKDYIEFIGSKSTDTRNLQISNQGGNIAFRCANCNIGNYISNDDGQVNYSELLKKLNIDENNIKYKILFDITLKLQSGKVFKAENVDLDFPVENIVNTGKTAKEITDLNNIIFKRIEN